MFRFGFGFGSLFMAFGVLGSGFVVSAQSNDSDELLTRVSAYVARYYARAQTLVATETVVVQPLTRDLKDLGVPRRVVNDTRLEWDATIGAAPRATRTLVSATGPQLGPPGRPDCLDPRSFSLEPLAVLLPPRRDTIRFAVRGVETIDAVRVRRIDYVPLTREPARVEWDGQCGFIHASGGTRGRIWVEPGSGAVLRFSEQLVGDIELPGPTAPGSAAAPRFTLERADTTITYDRVMFADPDETLRLPTRVESISVIRNSAVPRLRVTRTFENYRRFLTAGRIVN